MGERIFFVKTWECFGCVFYCTHSGWQSNYHYVVCYGSREGREGINALLHNFSIQINPWNPFPSRHKKRSGNGYELLSLLPKLVQDESAHHHVREQAQVKVWWLSISVCRNLTVRFFAFVLNYYSLSLEGIWRREGGSPVNREQINLGVTSQVVIKCSSHHLSNFRFNCAANCLIRTESILCPTWTAVLSRMRTKGKQINSIIWMYSQEETCSGRVVPLQT